MNVRSVVAGTQVLNAALFTGVTNLTASSVVANANTSVINGALATTYGVSGTTNAGGFSVGIRAQDLTGTTSTLNLTAAGAGLLQAVPGQGPINQVQTITMASTGVEAVTLATSGANNLALVDTPAVGVATDYATLTITGAGTNNVDVSALTQTLTYNASTATGNTTLNFGRAFQSNTSITGGTGTGDVIRVDQNSTVAGITVTGVETLRSSAGAAVSTGTIAFNTGSSITTLRVDGTSNAANNNGALGLINPGAIATVNYIGSGLAAEATVAQQFKAITMTGAFAGTADTLTVNLSNAGTTLLGAAGYNVRALSANGVEALVVNVTQADVASRATFVNGAGAVTGINSNTLQTVTFNSPAAVTATINAIPNAGDSTLTSVNLAAISTATLQSEITLVNGSVGLATQVLGATGTGGTALTIAGAEVATDVVFFTGGQGNDTVAGVGYLGTIIATMGQGTNAIDAGDGATNTTIATFSGVGSGNTITGGTGINTITIITNGLGATTTVNAEGGADIINGSASTIALTLNGDADDDRITGGSANDTINGGAGVDTMTGGTGTNTFRTTAIGDVTANTPDVITDFDLVTANILSFNGAAAGFDLVGANVLSYFEGATGTFAATNNIVVVTTAATALTSAAAATAIGSATAAYAATDFVLFLVSNGTDSAVFYFNSAAADATVTAAELGAGPIITLTGVNTAELTALAAANFVLAA